MKTSGLTGRKLDWAVATALGLNIEHDPDFGWIEVSPSGDAHVGMAPYSTNWALAGPLIAEHSISLILEVDRYPTEIRWEYRPGTVWQAYQGDVELYQGGMDAKFQAIGPTPLVAAMRCLVLAKLGAEVEIPEGLKMNTAQTVADFVWKHRNYPNSVFALAVVARGLPAKGGKELAKLPYTNTAAKRALDTTYDALDKVHGVLNTTSAHYREMTRLVILCAYACYEEPSGLVDKFISDLEERIPDPMLEEDLLGWAKKYIKNSKTEPLYGDFFDADSWPLVELCEKTDITLFGTRRS